MIFSARLLTGATDSAYSTNQRNYNSEQDTNLNNNANKQLTYAQPTRIANETLLTPNYDTLTPSYQEIDWTNSTVPRAWTRL